MYRCILTFFLKYVKLSVELSCLEDTVPKYFLSTFVLFHLLGLGALVMFLNGAPPPDLPPFVFGGSEDVAAFAAVNLPLYWLFIVVDAVYVFCYWQFLRGLFQQRGWDTVWWGRIAIAALHIGAALDLVENVLNAAALATGDVIGFTAVATNVKGLAMPLLFVGFYIAIRGWLRQRKEA